MNLYCYRIVESINYNQTEVRMESIEIVNDLNGNCM